MASVDQQAEIVAEEVSAPVHSEDGVIKTIFTSTLQPEVDVKEEGLPKTINLSIVDSTVVRFSATGGAWIYEAPTTPAQATSLSTPHLLKSLQHVYNSYPEWAGQTHWTTFDPTNTKGQAHRHGRVAVTFTGDASSDPGLHFIEVSHPKTVKELIPDNEERKGEWDVKARIPSLELLPTKNFPFSDNHTHQGLPNVGIQITRFACGGTGVGLKICHSYADATTMMVFMHDWAKVSRALLAEEELPVIPRRFNPGAVDALAGDIDAPSPDPTKLARSHALPVHRYSYWLSGEDCADFFKPQCTMPEELEGYPLPIGPGEKIPWKNWDLSVPVSHFNVHFSEKEVAGMWRAASLDGKLRITKMDAVQAHIWGCILRARGIEVGDECCLDMSMGFRPRLELPSDSIGSPLRLSYAAVDGSLAGPEDISTRAQRIREALLAFDKEALQALLHELAFEISAQRVWATFLGRNNTIVTSWTRIGVYDMDFGGDGQPVYMDACMPNCDGMLQVMEAVPGLHGPVDRSRADKDAWLQNGMDVGLFFREDVMKKMLEDSVMRMYR